MGEESDGQRAFFDHEDVMCHLRPLLAATLLLISTLIGQSASDITPDPRPFGIVVKASPYHDITYTRMSAIADDGDYVVWFLPSVIQHDAGKGSPYVAMWVVGTNGIHEPELYWTGKFEAYYVVYSKKRPPRRVDFFVYVK